MATYFKDPEYQKAETLQQHAVVEALEVAQKIVRDPLPSSTVPASLARIRVEAANTVKHWMWTILNRETIRHEGNPSGLARAIVNTFTQAIPLLRDAPSPSSKTRARMDAVIEALDTAVINLQQTEQGLEQAKQAFQAQVIERFPRDRKRADKIQIRASLITDLYDLADKLGIEHKGRADISNIALAELYSTVARESIEGDGSELNGSKGVVTQVIEGRYREPWLLLRNIINRIERSEDGVRTPA